MRRAFKGSLATIDGAERLSLRVPYHARDRRLRRPDLSHFEARPAHRKSRGGPARLGHDRRDRRARRSAARRAGHLYGRAEPAAEEAVRRRFLARHPEAAFYADFPDFAFWRSRWRARTISAASAASSISRRTIFWSPLDGAQGLVEAEPGIVEHMNEDHADAVELYATALADASPGAWRMVRHRSRRLRHRARGRGAPHAVRRSR